MGLFGSKPKTVYVGMQKEQYNDLKKQLGESKEALAKLQQSQEARERERQAEQQRMRQEMKDTQKRFEDDKKRQEQEMNRLRTEQSRRILKMDQEREKDRAVFQSRIDDIKKESERTMQRMTLEKLEQRREIMIRQIIMEREHYDAYFKDYFQAAEELTRLNARISAEESRLEKFMDVRHDPDCLRIVLFGKTGHGKSSVGCRMIGDRTLDMSGGGFKVSADTQSVTQSIKGLVVDPTDSNVYHLGYRQKFLVIDVPGTGETRGPEVASQHANRMVQYLKGIEFINTVGVVQSGTDTRCSGDTINMLRSLVAAFGNEVWPYVVLIITKVRSDYDYRDSRRMEMARREIDEWIEKFRREIRKQFGLSEYQAPLPAVKIDNKFERDYSEKCSTLVNTYASRFQRNPFRCDQLSSELDRWRNDTLMKEDEANEHRSLMTKSVTVMNALLEELTNIGNTLRDKAGPTGDYVDLISKARSMGVDVTLMYPINIEDVLRQIESDQLRIFESVLQELKKSYVIEDDEKDDRSMMAAGRDGYTMADYQAAPAAGVARDPRYDAPVQPTYMDDRTFSGFGQGSAMGVPEKEEGLEGYSVGSSGTGFGTGSGSRTGDVSGLLVGKSEEDLIAMAMALSIRDQ